MSRTGFFDPGAECRLVARRFEEIVRSDTADPGIAPGNVIILLPYALAGARPFPDCLSAARSMAMGNAFGAAHFLQQDRWLDGDESPVPSGARLSDVSFLRFVREYARLFPDSSVFWRHLERYIDEYHASLEWESTVLLSEDGGLAVAEEQLAGTLLKLGRKMSPLKASVVGMALLAGRLHPARGARSARPAGQPAEGGSANCAQ